MLVQVLTIPQVNWELLSQLKQQHGIDAIKGAAGEDKNSIRAAISAVDNLKSRQKTSTALRTSDVGINSTSISILFVLDLEAWANIVTACSLKGFCTPYSRTEVMGVLTGTVKDFRDLCLTTFNPGSEEANAVSLVRSRMIMDLNLKEIFERN